MNSTKRNYWLDVTIFVALLIITITGFLLWLAFPHKLNIVFLGSSRSVWFAVHICFGLVGLAGVILHIFWHSGWLKALRGRSLGGMQKKLRANRVVDRTMWFVFIATNVFGAMAWSLSLGVDTYIVRIPNRLHVVFGIACTILVMVHLALHWKWIAFSSQRQIHINFRGSSDLQKQEKIYSDSL